MPISPLFIASEDCELFKNSEFYIFRHLNIVSILILFYALNNLTSETFPLRSAFSAV